MVFFLEKVQRCLFQLFSLDEQLQKIISGVYTVFSCDALYPFIYLKNFKCHEVTLSSNGVTECSCDIIAYTAEEDNRTCLAILEIIQRCKKRKNIMHKKVKQLVCTF